MFFIDKRKVISKVFIFALFPTEVEEWRSPERNPEAKDDERRAATPTKPTTPRDANAHDANARDANALWNFFRRTPRSFARSFARRLAKTDDSPGRERPTR